MDIDVKLYNGQCPVDRMAVEFARVGSAGVDLFLMPAQYAFSTKCCPVCLTASSEPDFLVPANDDPVLDSLQQSITNSYSNTRRDLMQSLPARIAIVNSHLAGWSDEEMACLVKLRQPAIEKKVMPFFKTLFPGLPEANRIKIVAHVCSALVKTREVASALKQVLTHSTPIGKLPPNDPFVKLVKLGLPASTWLEAMVLGAYVGQFDIPFMKVLDQGNPLHDRVAIKLGLIHLALERLSLSVQYGSSRGVFRDALVVQTGFADPAAIIGAVDKYVNSQADGKAHSGYSLLGLGKNCYKHALLMEKVADGSREDVCSRMKSAVMYLEMSLRNESYPQIEKIERLLFVNQQGSTFVPFVFGEFGVRYMLCRAYDVLDSIENTSDAEHEKNCSRVVQLWTDNAREFRRLEFGRFSDPQAIQVLFPRMLVLPDVCRSARVRAALMDVVTSHTARATSRDVEESARLKAEFKQTGR